MIHYNWYRSGALFAMRYIMTAGSQLKTHVHDETTEHNVVVLNGHVRFEGDTTVNLYSGAVFDFDGTRPHRIVAVDDSVILNFMLNGIPPGYADLPPSEQSGVIP